MSLDAGRGFYENSSNSVTIAYVWLRLQTSAEGGSKREACSAFEIAPFRLVTKRG